MRTITRMMLASVLAVGAGIFAGCGDTDCPEDIANQPSCSSAGLTCTTSTATCKCDGTSWSCEIGGDMPISIRDMTPPRDLAESD